MSQYQPDYGGYTPQPPSGLAVASMCCGICSVVMFCLWWLSAPLAVTAITLGLIAKSQIRRGAAGGNGMATAGIICGAVALLLIVILIAGGIALFVTALVAGARQSHP